MSSFIVSTWRITRRGPASPNSEVLILERGCDICRSSVELFACFSVGLPGMAHPSPSTCPEDKERKTRHLLVRIRMAQSTIKCYVGERKFFPVQVAKARAGEGGRGVAPPILNLGNRWMWVVSFTLRPHYSRKDGLVPIKQGSIAGLDPLQWTEISPPCRDPTPEVTCFLCVRWYSYIV